MQEHSEPTSDTDISPPLATPNVDAPGSRNRWRGLVWGCAIVTATFVAYIPALRSGYIWDDGEYLYRNDLVRTSAGLGAIWSIPSDPETGRLLINTPQYYPLVYTTFWVEYKLWELNPAGFHAVNVALHALSALLLWRIGRRVGLPGAWLIAGVFALHPVHVESVAWITERKNILSGFLYFLSLAAFLNYFERGRTWRYALGMALFAAALLSKTVTCSLPVALVLIIWFKRSRLSLREVLALTPIFIVGATGGLFTAYLERTHVGAANVEWSSSLFERSALVAPRAFLFYAEKIAWPNPLIFIYPRWSVSASAWADYLPLAVAAAAFILAAIGVRRFGWGPLLLLAFSGATLTPALGFFEVYPHRFSWVADHFQYLGSIGFIALYVAIIAWLGRRLLTDTIAARVGRFASAGVLLGLSFLTFQHSRSFKDAGRLWEDTLAANPDAWIGSINLGIQAAEAGDHGEAARHFEHTISFPEAVSEGYGSWGNSLLRAQKLDGAIDKFEKALVADPTNAKALVGLGAAIGQSGRISAAMEKFDSAARIDPQYVTAWMNLGMGYTQERSWDEAERCFRRARDLAPCVAGIRLALANMLFDAKRWSSAAEEYVVARRFAPHRFNVHHKLVRALYESGDYAAALQTCNEALADDSDNADLLRTLAWIRATCPDDELRDGAAALQIIEALPANARNDLRNVDTRACAVADTGNFTQAAKFADAAATAARRAGKLELAKQIEARAALFRAGEPYRHQPRVSPP